MGGIASSFFISCMSRPPLAQTKKICSMYEKSWSKWLTIASKYRKKLNLCVTCSRKRFFGAPPHQEILHERRTRERGEFGGFAHCKQISPNNPQFYLNLKKCVISHQLCSKMKSKTLFLPLIFLVSCISLALEARARNFNCSLMNLWNDSKMPENIPETEILLNALLTEDFFLACLPNEM